MLCSGLTRPLGFILRLATFTAGEDVLGMRPPSEQEHLAKEWVGTAGQALLAGRIGSLQPLYF
jgi:hypothetical protein